MKPASLCLPCRARFPGHLARCPLCDKPVEHIDLDDAPGKGMPDLVAARVGRRPTDLSWWWTVSWSLGPTIAHGLAVDESEAWIQAVDAAKHLGALMREKPAATGNRETP